METPMTDKQTQQQAPHSNMEKAPENWVTGDEPMTGAQRSYLKTLSEEAHVPFEDGLTKAQASKRIDELQVLTGRGEHAKMALGSSEENQDGPLESLGRAVSDAVLGSAPPGQAGDLAPDATGRKPQG
jgi:hypothetical protein